VALGWLWQVQRTDYQPFGAKGNAMLQPIANKHPTFLDGDNPFGKRDLAPKTRRLPKKSIDRHQQN
jgi:hypothetical protein